MMRGDSECAMSFSIQNAECGDGNAGTGHLGSKGVCVRCCKGRGAAAAREMLFRADSRRLYRFHFVRLPIKALARADSRRLYRFHFVRLPIKALARADAAM